MYAYICMYVYICICMCIIWYICIQKYIDICICICISISIYPTHCRSRTTIWPFSEDAILRTYHRLNNSRIQRLKNQVRREKGMTPTESQMKRRPRQPQSKMKRILKTPRSLRKHHKVPKPLNPQTLTSPPNPANSTKQTWPGSPSPSCPASPDNVEDSRALRGKVHIWTIVVENRIWLWGTIT